ncbi:hypothetical protein DKP50_15260 [Salmonella enterica subsp. enterica serovar Napoli]|nr:hypothetical protein [Salmonella enterica subsp. enterica serovar Napoli]
MNKSRKQYLRIKKPKKKNTKIGEGIIVVSDGKVHGGNIGFTCRVSDRRSLIFKVSSVLVYCVLLGAVLFLCARRE